jgi:hypothetical protein
MKVSRVTLYNWMDSDGVPQAAKLYQLARVARSEGRAQELLDRLYEARLGDRTVGEYLLPAALGELQTELLSLDAAKGLRILERAAEAIAAARHKPVEKSARLCGGLSISSKQYLAAEVLRSDFVEVEEDIDRIGVLAHELIRERPTGECTHAVLLVDLSRRMATWGEQFRRTEFLDRALPLLGVDSSEITIRIWGRKFEAKAAASPQSCLDRLEPQLHIVNYCLAGIGA